MHQQNFDDLAKGFLKEGDLAAKWADLGSSNKLREWLSLQVVKLTAGQKEEVREEITKHEEPIPAKILSEINEFVAEHRKLGTRGRTIKRMVKRLWNIKTRELYT